MKRITLILLSFCIFSAAIAQLPTFPRSFQPKSAMDYSSTQGQAVQCMRWFLETPASVNPEYYQLVYSFIFKWVAGAPNLHLVLEPKITAPILDEKNERNNPDILMAYLAGMALYLLENPNETDQAAIQLEGVRAVLKVCENNPDFLSNSKAAREYRKIQESGNLDGWVKENLTSQ